MLVHGGMEYREKREGRNMEREGGSGSGQGRGPPSSQAKKNILSSAFSLCRAHLDIKLTTMNDFLSRFFL